MPVKARCPSCKKVLTLPDAARGKRAKCRHCGNPVPVPGGKVRRTPAVRTAGGGDPDLADALRIGSVEDQQRRVCPRCATVVGEDDIECPKCHVNLETGLLSKKMKVMLERGGPDPDEYWGDLWRDGFQFLREHLRLGVQTWISWSIYATVAAGSTYMALYCERLPLIAFWSGLAFVSWVTIIGWYWYLTIALTGALLRKEKTPRIQLSFVSCAALGIRGVAWPVAQYAPMVCPLVLAKVLSLHFGVVADAVQPLFDMLDSQTVRIAAGVLLLLPYFAYPVAATHMAMPYTYKAWLPFHMAKLTFKRFPQVLYWWLWVLIAHLPFVLVAALLLVFRDSAIDAFLRAVAGLTNTIWGGAITVSGQQLSIPENARGAMTSLMIALNSLVLMLLANLVVVATLAFPGVVVARMAARFAHFFRRDLETIQYTVENEAVPFGARYLIGLVDFVIIFAIEGVAAILFFVFYKVVATAAGESTAMSFIYAFYAVLAAFPFVYYVFQECGPNAGTLGKVAFGVRVQTFPKGKFPIKRDRAIRRAVTRIVTALPAGLGMLMVLVHPEKLAPHDLLSQTRVVWVGDDVGE